MFLEGKTTGTFKSIEEPVYVSFVSIARVKDLVARPSSIPFFNDPASLTFVFPFQFMRNTFFVLNRLGDVEAITVDNTDYLFKRALQQKNLVEVREILSRGTLCGRSIICYLKE